MTGRSTVLLALYQDLVKDLATHFEANPDLNAKNLYRLMTSGEAFGRLKAEADDEELALALEFLKRDIGTFLQERNQDSISHSPSFIALENTLWHWLAEITDRSQLEWHELAQDFKHHGYYQSGEIVSQGRMVCTSCGHGMDIEFASTIPDCPECDNDEFIREALAP
ncbi:hypothetical protein KJI95_08885 [Shewanella sp. JM162201]|uniref:Zinc ribbon-containing protein n=1 Tax=Shewanella jiangmenensis TaxID=2837387 RepID=A0ABS5V3X1_9GAMM|nr:zinc ribbon-containing protein [Shewanella jiangmenensis]MBT1444638.1 hypothetical protein [Shewanella jiangmenensis]